MRVVHVSPYRDPEGRAPGHLLEAWPALVDVPAAVAATGIEVHVVQAATHGAQLERRGVTFHFVPESATRWTMHRPWLTRPSPELLERVRACRPDVVHVHSLSFPLAVARIARAVRSPVLVQDHADQVPPRWRRVLTASALGRVRAVAFTARAQAEAWRAAGVLPAGVAVVEVPESSSHFTPGDQAAARRAAGVSGAPAVAWVGRLRPVKDPLTALDGFARAVPDLPDPHLWCCSTDAPLLAAVEARVHADARLRGRVHLLGALPHADVETLLRACDGYLAASRREGSGFALIEAMACGLPPIVTDIPSFRTLTGDGAVGALYGVGDAEALARALVAWWAAPRDGEREAVRARFDRSLSFDAVGARLRATYAALCERSCG